MTKPANFPARKDARRVRALERLERAPVPDKHRPSARWSHLDQINKLALRLDAGARDIRTKKVRGERRA
mgnify:CR=1 FL=1